jgi:hypothetical protein
VTIRFQNLKGRSNAAIVSVSVFLGPAGSSLRIHTPKDDEFKQTSPCVRLPRRFFSSAAIPSIPPRFDDYPLIEAQFFHLRLLIPFLDFCHIVSHLPIQLVTSFAASVADLRYANQLLSSALHGLRDRSRPVADLARACSIATQLLDSPEPVIRYWTVGIRDFLDHHFDVRLSDYISRDKREFVRIMLEQCPTATKLRDLSRNRSLSSANAIHDFLTVIAIGKRPLTTSDSRTRLSSSRQPHLPAIRGSVVHSSAKTVLSGTVGQTPRSMSMLQVRATTLGPRNENRCVESPSVVGRVNAWVGRRRCCRQRDCLD